MKVDLSKLKIELPEGVTKKTEPKIGSDGTSATFVVHGDKAVDGNIGVTYKDGNPVNCHILVKDATIKKIYDNVMGVVAGKDFTVRVEFDMPPVLSEVQISVPSDWTVSKEAYIEGNDVIAVYTTKNITDAAKITVSYKGTSKELTINVRDPQINSLQTITSDKSEYTTGEDIVLTLNYKHNVEDKDKPELTGSLPEGVTEKTPLAKAGKTWTVTYTASTAGEKAFTFTAYKGDKVNQASRMIKVTVK